MKIEEFRNGSGNVDNVNGLRIMDGNEARKESPDVEEGIVS